MPASRIRFDNDFLGGRTVDRFVKDREGKCFRIAYIAEHSRERGFQHKNTDNRFFGGAKGMVTHIVKHLPVSTFDPAFMDLTTAYRHLGQGT